jgi:transcriptional regulator with XRE-family HTH domain
MADKVTGPLGPRRRIAAALRKLRLDSGRNLNDLAVDLMMSTSKLSRLENAQGRPLPRDIRDVIHHYSLDKNNPDLARNLRRWVQEAQVSGWWTDFEEVVTQGLDAHLAYEADAAVERVYTVPFVPALLQTREYAKSIFRDMEGRTEGQIERLLLLRDQRQQALTERHRLEPLQLIAVTHESSLRQVVGSPQVLRDQLAALVERSRAPNVSLHVFPFDATPVFSMTCMYAYFQYDVHDGEQDVVHVETHAGFFSIEDPAKVARYRAAHAAMVEASLSREDSRSLVSAIRDSLRY